MSYFNYFPIIDYTNQKTRNLVLKAAIVADVLSKSDSFYPYIIKDYERPDIVAYNEYDDETLDWVVFFSNNIVDPYYQWPLTQEQFIPYIEKKYNKTVYEVQGEISHYKYTGITGETEEDIARKSWLMSPTTHQYIDDTSGWTPVYLYDYEYELNEAKRSIRLLNKFYIPQMKSEIKKIMNI